MAKLILDTSSLYTVCAVCIPDKVIAGGVLVNEHIRDQLPSEVFRVVAEGKLEIDELILGIGPGSYTGLRTGAIIAKSFGYFREIPIRTVQSLKGLLPMGYPLGKYLLIAPAGRSRYYGVSFDPERLFANTSTLFSLAELYDVLTEATTVLSSVDIPKEIVGKWVKLLPDPLRLLREASVERFSAETFYSGVRLNYSEARLEHLS